MAVIQKDHYKGINNTFENGIIICQKKTGIMLALKFPGVQHLIQTAEYNEPFIVYMNKEKTKSATVVFLDANHIIGSAMILFYGFFGTILYSGDLRYHQCVIDNNPFLFEKDGSLKMKIDELILDNTYCDPVFDFPSQDAAINLITQIIQHHKTKNEQIQVYMYCYTIGKEEICMQLAKDFNTKIVLDADRYMVIKQVNFFPQYFTSKKEEGFIYLTKGVNRVHKDMDDKNIIHINLTGWINSKSYIKVNENEYLVAYSSHSNFKELEKFTNLINPGYLNRIVLERENQVSVRNVKTLNSYFMWLKNLKQSGFQLLQDRFQDQNKLSEEYKQFFDLKKQQENYKEIGIDNSIQDVNYKMFIDENKAYFGRKIKKDNQKGVQLKRNNKIDKMFKQEIKKGKQKMQIEQKNKKVSKTNYSNNAKTEENFKDSSEDNQTIQKFFMAPKKKLLDFNSVVSNESKKIKKTENKTKLRKLPLSLLSKIKQFNVKILMIIKQYNDQNYFVNFCVLLLLVNYYQQLQQ